MSRKITKWGAFICRRKISTASIAIRRKNSGRVRRVKSLSSSRNLKPRARGNTTATVGHCSILWRRIVARRSGRSLESTQAFSRKSSREVTTFWRRRPRAFLRRRKSGFWRERALVGGIPIMSFECVNVIGGGLAGLSAAVALADSGVRVRLFEKRPHLGGRATSYLLPDGSHIDNCQHVTLGCCTNLADFYTRVGSAGQIRYYDQLYFADARGDRFTIAPSSLAPPFHMMFSFLRFSALTWADKVAIGRAMMQIATTGGHPPGVEGTSMLDWLHRMKQTPAALDRFGASCWSARLTKSWRAPTRTTELTCSGKHFSRIAKAFVSEFQQSRFPNFTTAAAPQSKSAAGKCALARRYASCASNKDTRTRSYSMMARRKPPTRSSWLCRSPRCSTSSIPHLPPPTEVLRPCTICTSPPSPESIFGSIAT